MTLAAGGALYELWVVLGALTGTPSPPPPIPLRIAFESPSDCSSEQAFYQGLRARSERIRLADPGESATVLSVRLSVLGGTAHGELRMEAEHGEEDTRRVDGGTCDEIVEALSLTAALALDPAARVAPPPAPPPEAPPEAPPPLPPPTPEPPVAEPTTLGLELSAAFVVSEVVSPYLNIGGALTLRVRMEGEGSAEPSFGVSFVRLQNDFFGAPAAASIRLTAVAVSGCPARWNVEDAVTLEPCLLVLGGWLGAAGKGFDHTSSVLRSFFSAGGSLTLGVPLGAAAIELTGGLTLPLVTRGFVGGTPPRSLGETPPVSPIGGLGLRYGF